MSVKPYNNPVKEKPATITAAAQCLGVHRVYLSAVLHGRMKSKKLMHRVCTQFPHLIEATRQGKAPAPRSVANRQRLGQTSKTRRSTRNLA